MDKTVRRITSALFAALLFLPMDSVSAEDENPSPATAAPAREETLAYKFELKRENTNKGQQGETTKTTLRLEHDPGGAISLLRLDVPFVDKNKSFGGDLASQGLGDIKVRVGVRRIPFWSPVDLSGFVEVVFPTASPKDLGSGMYQLAPAVKFTVPLYPGPGIFSAHDVTGSAEVQQYLSLGGFGGFKDIDYTKFDFQLKDVWRKKYWAILKVKPVIDWEQDGRWGGTAEVEIGWFINRRWSLYVSYTNSLPDGNHVPGTCEKRVTLDVACRF
jgi:hypothetical protein